MGSSIGSIFGLNSGGPSTGGVGGVDDLKSGLQDQSNEILSGMGADRDTRVKRQQQFAEQLYNQATGNAPSLANAQLRAAMDRNLAQQLAVTKANRAVNPALAQRQIMNAAGQQQQQTAQAGALAAMQERQQAQQQFADYMGRQQAAAAQIRAQAMGGAQAGANIDAYNSSRLDRYLGAALGGASQGAAMAAMSDKNQKKNIKPIKMAMGGIIPDVAGGEMPEQEPVDTSGIAGMFKKSSPKQEMLAGQPTMFDQMQQQGVMLAANGGQVPGQPQVDGDSEVNDTVPALLSPGEMVVPRTVVNKGPQAIKSFAQALYDGGYVRKMNAGGVVKPLNLDKLQAYEYEYKNPKHGQGKHVSVMAQDLEKAGPAGKQMVIDTPEGKMVDYGKGFAAMLASQAALNERLNKIEKKKK